MRDFTFSLDNCKTLLTGNTEYAIWYIALSDTLPTHNIDTKLRVAAFLSQTAHESNNYSALVENLNYRPESLIKVWPSRFNSSNAWTYGRQPAAIANKVYAGRLGNGGESSGDGWKYRGRGILQITGKNNYTACSNYLFNDDRLVINPELVSNDKKIAIGSACWFWTTNNLNVFADRGDIYTLTRRINGGVNGLADRTTKYKTAMQILGT